MSRRIEPQLRRLRRPTHAIILECIHPPTQTQAGASGRTLMSQLMGGRPNALEVSHIPEKTDPGSTATATTPSPPSRRCTSPNMSNH